jgi:hypothetical protein
MKLMEAAEKAPEGTANIEAWLGQPSGETCDCGMPMARWEALNGACTQCRRPIPPPACQLPRSHSCRGGHHWRPSPTYGHFPQMDEQYEECLPFKIRYKSYLESKETP